MKDAPGSGRRGSADTQEARSGGAKGASTTGTKIKTTLAFRAMFPDRIRRNGQRPVRGVLLGWTDDGQVVVKFEDRRTTQILDADCIIGANNHAVGPMPAPGAD